MWREATLGGKRLRPASYHSQGDRAATDPTHGGQDGCGRGGSPDDVRERAAYQRFQREPGPTGLQRPICSAGAWGRQRGAGAPALKHPPRAPFALLLSVRMMTSASHDGIHRFARSVQTTLGLSHSNSWCVSCHSARPCFRLPSSLSAWRELTPTRPAAASMRQKQQVRRDPRQLVRFSGTPDLQTVWRLAERNIARTRMLFNQLCTCTAG